MEVFHMTNDEQNNLLNAVAGVCLRCFVLSICLMSLWFIFFLVGKDWVYRIHSRWFDIGSFDFDLILYQSMAFFKMAAFLFFLLPFISIKLILRKKK
jgi:hypothetical protein